MLSVIIVTRRAITSWNFGLQGEERKAKGQIRKEEGSLSQMTRRMTKKRKVELWQTQKAETTSVEEAWLAIVYNTFEEGKWGGGIDEDVPGEAMDLGDTINDYPNFDELTSKLIHPTPDLPPLLALTLSLMMVPTPQHLVLMNLLVPLKLELLKSTCMILVPAGTCLDFITSL